MTGHDAVQKPLSRKSLWRSGERRLAAGNWGVLAGAAVALCGDAELLAYAVAELAHAGFCVPGVSAWRRSLT